MLRAAMCLAAVGLCLSPLPAASADTAGAPEPDPIAAALSEATASGVDVVVDDLTSETQLVTATPDGRIMAQLSAEPVRVADGPQGSWVPVDTSLVAEPDGTLTPRHAAADIALSGGGDPDLASLASGDGSSLTVAWPGDLPQPQVDGSTATYPEVLPGVDLVAQAGTTGFSTYLVVKNAAAAANPALQEMVFPVEASQDLSMVDEGDGTLSAVSDSGAEFSTASAVMWDSAGIPEPEEDDPELLVDQPASAKTAQVDVALTPAGDMSVAPDLEMLTATNVDYPLVIDPSWNTASKSDSAWAMVWSDGSDWYNPTGQAPRVGYDGWSSATKKARSFYKFDLPNALQNYGGIKIHQAQLRMKMVHSPNWTCDLSSYGPGVEVYRVSTFGSGISWPGPSGIGMQDTIMRASGHEDLCAPEFPEADVTAGVRDAYSEGKSFVAFGLRSANESNRDGWRKFANGEYPDLTVWFDQPPSVNIPDVVDGITEPAIPADSVTARVTNNPTPTFKAGGIQDRDGDSVDVCFKLAGKSTVECDNNVAPGDLAQVTWPATLSDGTYQLYAVATSGIGSLSYTTAQRRVVIDSTIPTNLVVSYSPGPWQLGVARPVTFTADGDPLAFRYTLNGSDPTCSTGTSVAAVPGAGTTGSASVNVAATQAGNNWLRVVACDRATNASGVHTTPPGTILTAAAQPWHAWDWDSSTVPAPGTDSGMSGASLSLTDVPASDRGPVAQGPRPFNGADDHWLRLGTTQQRAEASGSALAGLTSGFTVAGWVKVTGPVTSSQAIVAQSGPASDSVRLSATSSGWQFTVSDGNGGSASTASLDYSTAGCGPGAWCYVAGVWTPSVGARLVVVPAAVNPTGVESLVTAPASTPSLSGGTLRIGQAQTGVSGGNPVLGLPLSGGIDRLRVFNAPMSATDIANAAQG